LSEFLLFYSAFLLEEKFQGHMLICRNAEGVHGQTKVGNPCSKPLHQRIVGYSPCTHIN